MRQFLYLCRAALLAAVLCMPGTALAVDDPDYAIDTEGGTDFSALPTEIDELRTLEERHRILAEDAARTCMRPGEADTRRTGLSAADNPCAERAVRRELDRIGDPALTAFHNALPLDVRYNNLREEIDWMPTVKSRIAQSEALWERQGGPRDEDVR